MAEQWTPWFAWTMDLLKSGISFGITAVVTVGIINRIQEKHAGQRSRADALLQFRMDALREFRRGTIMYETAARAAYTDLYQWKVTGKTASMTWYEGIAYGELQGALDGIRYTFGENAKAMQLLDDLRANYGARHSIYDGIVDKQLDAEARLDLWSLCNERREQFDHLLEHGSRIRHGIISTVEAEILSET